MPTLAGCPGMRCRTLTSPGGQKQKPILELVIKDGKKIAMKKKMNIGVPISFQIYIFILKRKG
jgi:hypothetical protein